jgi:hydroxymethylpyrimidine/phosphomethylpyrimidine kinase
VLDADLVADQIRAVIEDIPPHAAKLGALGNSAVARAVEKVLEDAAFPVVVDPVMRASLGGRLGPVAMLKAFLITPNLEEASELAGFAVNDLASMRAAADIISAAGAKNVLVKGGHLIDPAGAASAAIDVLRTADGVFHEFAADRIETRHTHGTGCTYSAAITAELAKGTGLIEAVGRAKTFVTEAIRSAPGLGHGAGPLNHFAQS